MDQPNKFMFALQLAGVNLNNGSRYFDIEFKLESYVNGRKIDDSVQIELEPCTYEHWNITE